MSLISPLASSLLIRRPELYLLSAPIVALAALSTTPSAGPLVLLLTILQLHVHTFLPRGKLVSHGVVQVFLVSLAASLTHLRPSLHALSTPTVSIVVLSVLSLLTSAISIAAIAASYHVNRVGHTAWSKLSLFPALWASTWAVVSYLSPIGRLGIWSPVVGLGPYAWMRSVVGQAGIDWVVAAWAVLCFEIVGQWLVGSPEDEDPGVLLEQQDLLTGDTLQNAYSKSVTSQSSSPRIHHMSIMTGILVFLAIPSYFISSFPLPTVSLDTTPLNVACALPGPQRSGETTRWPTLQDYMGESKTLEQNAEIILWPEGAVQFDSAAQKEDVFQHIISTMAGRKVYGVSFEESAIVRTPGSSQNSTTRRNGFALLTKEEGVVLEYYKRMLVPIAESFSQISSSDPPSVFTWDLKAPKNWAKTKWSPLPGNTRPIPITASICLDFSSPNSFAALDTRPALILAPARTWHIDIGYAMWEQARARAEELGSMVLWCDGGEGGVNGVAGGGMHEFYQVGQGSWIRRVGVQWPFDQHRTFFSMHGGYTALAIMWALTGTGAVAEIVLPMIASRAGGLGLVNRLQMLGGRIRNLRLRGAVDERRPLLE